ncbi:MAG: DUF6272 family protein [Flavobacteriales bacterium]|nr:DUF6272 family protein [Flavobacteriales bacterium]
MDSRSITPLLSSLDTDAWLFAYGGDFTEDHSARLLELASLAGGQFDGFNAKQAGYVLVEAYQNIIRHRAKLPVSGSCGPGEGLFVFRIDRNGLGVYTGNAVTGSAASELDQALASLRNKDASELKLLFLRGIQQPGSPGQRGAGLGLIEMVRRSGADPKWSFGPMHAGHQWFSLVLEQEARPRQDSLQALVEEHLCPWMLGNGVVCLQVAPWSPGLGETLMSMARTEVPLRIGTSQSGPATREQGPSAFMSQLAVGHRMAFLLHGRDRHQLSIGGQPGPQSGLHGHHAPMSGAAARPAGQPLAWFHGAW